MSGQPYDPRAAALDVLAALRHPDISQPTAGQVRIVEDALREAALAGAQNRPLVPPR